jgi:hypothetical protein
MAGGSRWRSSRSSPRWSALRTRAPRAAAASDLRRCPARCSHANRRGAQRRRPGLSSTHGSRGRILARSPR